MPFANHDPGLILLDMVLSDFYALHVLVGVGGWALGCAMAIHGLELAKPTRLRFWIYSCLCILAGLLAWLDLAIGNSEGRLRDAQNTELATAIGGMKDTASEQNTEIGDLKKQSNSLIEMGTTLARNVNDLQDKMSQLAGRATSHHVSSADAAKDIAGRVATLLEDRTIDNAAASRMEATLKTISPAKVRITTVLGDAEAFRYATRIMDILKRAGWQVDGLNQAIFTAPAMGIMMQVADDKHLPREANVLARALHDADIRVAGQLVKDISPDELRLVVGSKPVEGH
jgi:regulator of replication initiation timing